MPEYSTIARTKRFLFPSARKANGSNQRRQITSDSAPAPFNRPLHLNCYVAALLTTLLFANFLLLENEHRVSPESDRIVVQGLQSRHHSQATDDL